VSRSRDASAGLRLAFALAVLAFAMLPALASGAVDDTALVSRADGSGGAPANADSAPGLALSGSGRYVAFTSAADNLSDADDDTVLNVYLRDTDSGVTTLLSRADGVAGAGATSDSRNPAVSPDGQFVAFESDADNLSDGDDDSVTNIYVRDTQAGTTTLVSRAAAGPANGASHNPSVSNNGAFIAFDSAAANLSDTDDDSVVDVFVHDMSLGTNALVSRPSTGAANGNSYDPSISSSGQKIAFTSDADNLMDVDVDAFSNVYVADRRFAFLTHVSRTTISGAIDQPADSPSSQPSISPEGRHVAFVSRATNLAGISGAVQQAYVRDTQANLTTLVSRAPGETGAPADAAASAPTVASEGRVVSFVSAASNLSAEDGDGADFYVRAGAPIVGGTMRYDRTVLGSRASGASGAAADGQVLDAAISSDSSTVAFLSTAGNLGFANPGGLSQVYAREFFFEALPPPPPETGGGHGHGDDGHGDGHTAGDGHSAGHGAGSAHFSLRLGAAGSDRLFGTPGHDKLCGLGGDDTIHLAGGPDVAYGDMCGNASPPVDDGTAIASISAAPPPNGAKGNDDLVGGTGKDQLYGGWGNDRLVGGSGDDALYGGVGRDRLVGGPGSNVYRGGPGKDSINSRNGVEDLVDCGAGRDTARVDRIDFVKGCETVKRKGKARRGENKLDPSLELPECPGGGHACHENSSDVIVALALG
jgi:Tol biopolymer transport system component